MEITDFLGIANISLGQFSMILICLLLLYLAIAKKFEPLLLLPIGFGGLLANIPEAGLADPGGILYFFYESGIKTTAFPLIIFMGVGALTDFGPLLANPKTMLLGAAAQVGIFATIFGAVGLSLIGLVDFSIQDAAAIGIIGGADGPTTIFISTRMREIGHSLPDVDVRDIVGATAVAAYSYMALVPIIQPPIIKLLTTKSERRIKMEYPSKEVSKRAKILFPIICTVIISILGRRETYLASRRIH